MQHGFISYMHKNQDIVDKFYEKLTSRGIKVWLDRDDIAPGSFWKDAIRKAIQEGAFFIACFSKAYNQSDKTYMNEELRIAIPELRQRHRDRAWFIPVKLDRCKIPDWNIGAGETLHDIQHIKLYKDWDAGIQEIINTIQPETSEPQNSRLTNWIYQQTTQHLLEAGQIDAAIEGYSHVLDLDPRHFSAYINRGITYQERGEFEESINDLNRAIELNPNEANAYMDRGVVYLKKGEFDLAIEDFNKAIQLNPNDSGAYSNRGALYGERGEFEKSINDLNRAIELNPNDDYAYMNRGIAYMEKNELYLAIEDYTKVIQI